MPSGNTTTDALTDSLNDVVAAARAVREYEGKMSQLVERHTLEEGTGLSWRETVFAKLTAMSITEHTVNENYQQFSDSDWSITPTMVQVATLVTDRVARRIDKKAYARMGSLAMNAMVRMKDTDGLAVLDGFTTSLGGAGTTLTTGLIAAASTRISSNTTEPFMGAKRAVLHGFQIKDIYDELTASIGTSELTEGMTARVFKEGFRGKVADVMIYEDGNLTIDGDSDAKGGVFASDAIVLVQGMNLKRETERKPNIGGGSTALYLTDEYAYGERLGANTTGVGGYEIYTDATAPTS